MYKRWRKGRPDKGKENCEPTTLGRRSDSDNRTDMGTGKSDVGIGVVSDKGAAIGDWQQHG